MTLIQTVTPQNATGDIQQGYDVFQARGLEVPAPLWLISASPGYFKIMMQRNQYYANHPNLSFSLLAHIRYFVSGKIGYRSCQLFNKNVLAMQGLSKEDLEKMDHDPGQSLLEEKEQRMLLFVLKAMDHPDAIAAEDIDHLQHVGWKDSDIFDALAQGVGMMDHLMFMKVFKPEFA